MTIKEIAALADVSPATVSRYINNGYISKEKRERIRAIIEQTGYSPSIHAQTLRTRKTMLIGVIVPKINSESISRMISGISHTLSEAGYQMLLGDAENDREKELEYLNLFKNNPVDGIILFGTSITDKHKIFIENNTIPLVVVGQKTSLVSCIYHDDQAASFALTEKMILSGKKNLAFLGVTPTDPACGIERKQGFLDALSHYQLNFNPRLEEICDFTVQSGYDHMDALLQKRHVFDGVFCATDMIAAGAIKRLREENLDIPGQVAITGIGHNPICMAISPRLTTAHFHYRICGRHAANLLLSLINDNNEIVSQTKLGFEIIEGETV
ncbi:MAG: LacI family DNA-binding transcriptional regulator [Lachnospiraceae bacterium]|nr:LacI family DNA-binding transcriptional regulator [Lachnospiraceae bacterium]MDY4968936.1 LacI family DNA-binding transcriptional regulator [Lachnospiraceae bacterium]